MKIWLVLEANNCESDIFISEPFYSAEAATKHLKEVYEEIMDSIGEDGVDLVSHNDTAYSILTYGSDYYYGVVRSIDIKEGAK
jgi:F420-0:gamma-glutamyl ligase-like protein